MNSRLFFKVLETSCKNFTIENRPQVTMAIPLTKFSSMWKFAVESKSGKTSSPTVCQQHDIKVLIRP